jgi:hypothetical protein
VKAAHEIRDAAIEDPQPAGIHAGSRTRWQSIGVRIEDTAQLEGIRRIKETEMIEETVKIKDPAIAVYESGPRHAKRAHTRAATTRTQRFMVLGSGPDDVCALDLRTKALIRLRVDGHVGLHQELKAFDLVDAEIAADPERDDLAHPEAVTISGYPEVVGTTPKRQARRYLRALVAPNERNLLGFPGSAAPYWEFRGMRPSVALVAPALGPLLFRRKTDDTTWARFGWARNDNWLPVEDPRATQCLWSTGKDRLTGKDLASALGFRPRYLLIALTPPRAGHCYKTVAALLPRP